jgi:ABC-2 type transport system ATP-binding protein
MIQAIKTTGLTKTYGEKRALDDVNLVVPEGSIFGFLGPNGAGKTTTLRILTGLARPTSGSVQILSHDVAMAGNEVRADVGFLPDVPGFYEWMTAEGLLRFAGRLFLCSPSRCREPPSSSPRQRSTRCSSRSWSSL